MTSVKSIYPVVHTDNEDDISFLFLNYYQKSIVSDEHLSDTYLQIERQLRRLFIRNNLLYNNKSEVKELPFPIKDRLGNIRYPKIVKKMISVTHVYEIRLDEQYVHHRILFFPLANDAEKLMLPALVFSFAFGKEEGKEDPTQRFTEQTQEIRDSVYLEKITADIIGKEFSA